MSGFRPLLVMLAATALLASPPAMAGKRELRRTLDRATLQVRDGEYEAATELLASVDEASLNDRWRQTWRYLLLRGLTRLRLGDYDGAIVDLERHMELHREEHGDLEWLDPLVFVYLGQAHYFAGNTSQAKQMLEASGERGDRIPGVWALRGSAARKLGRLEDARDILEQGLVLHAGDPTILRAFALVEIEADRMDPALRRAEQWLATEGRSEGDARMLVEFAEDRERRELAEALRGLAAGTAAYRSDVALEVRSPVPPDYPAQARDDGVEGYVIARVFVDAEGRVERVEIEDAEPAGIFEEAARRSLLQWTFEPPMADGQAVRAIGEQRITFRLRDRPSAEAASLGEAPDIDGYRGLERSPAVRSEMKSPPLAVEELDDAEGTVALRVFVDADGRVDRVVVEESDFPDAFGEAVREMVTHWTFEPVLVDGVPVRATFPMPIVFD